MVELNSGQLKIYEITPSKSTGGKPIETLSFKKNAWYGDLDIVTSEYYSAKQANTEIVKRVRILQDRSLTSLNIIVIDNKQYKVGRTFSGKNQNGMPITDITLERVVKSYEIT